MQGAHGRIEVAHRQSARLAQGAGPTMEAAELTIDEVLAKGCEVLARELGPVNYVRFMQRMGVQRGDFTEERRAWAETLDLDSIARMIEVRRGSVSKKL